MEPFEVATIAVADVPADAVLLDCRELGEWQAGHIDGARHVPMNSVPQHFAHQPETFASDTPVVVVCKMGGRSSAVAGWLVRNGVDAVNLDGGLLAWVSAGRTLVTDDGTAGTVV